MYEIHFAHSAEKSYDKLDLDTCKRINEILSEFEKGNFHNPNTRALHGYYKGCRRFRVGSWRMIYKIDHSRKIVLISAIIMRKDAYKD